MGIVVDEPREDGTIARPSEADKDGFGGCGQRKPGIQGVGIQVRPVWHRSGRRSPRHARASRQQQVMSARGEGA